MQDDSNAVALEPVSGRADPDFGRKMQALTAQRGEWRSGRKRASDKYPRQFEEAEAMLAEALPETVRNYIAELYNLDPEQCSVHKVVLSCHKCGERSQRRVFNHTAAAYHMDRMWGRPTSRSENTITIKLYQQLSVLFVEAFQAVNEIADANERKLAYAERLEVIEQQYGGHGGS